MKKLIFGLSLFMGWIFAASVLYISIRIQGSFNLIDYYFSIFLFFGCILFTFIAFYEFRIYLEKHEESKTKG